MHPAFNSRLGGFSSDHTWRGIQVQFLDTQKTSAISGIDLRGATWNMMNRAHGLRTNKETGKTYSNNPFDIEENDQQYEARKMQQITELEKILDSQAPDELDFIFLQEVDWAQVLPTTTKDLTQNQKNSVENALRAKIMAAIQSRLQARGYDLVITKHRPSDLPPGYNQQALVTIYNTGTLKPMSSKGAFPCAPDKNGVQRFRGHETIFTHIKSKKPVVLTNLHLDFNEDYTKSVDQYLNDKTQNNLPTVMGGDTNHPQNTGVLNLVTDWYSPSNIDADPSKSDGSLTDEDIRATQKKGNSKKSYDGFFATPAYPDSRVRIIEETNATFDLSADRKSARVRVYNPSFTDHLSEKGKPWKRVIYILQDMDDELGALTNPQAKMNKYNEMLEVLKRRLGVTDLNNPKALKYNHLQAYRAANFGSPSNNNNNTTTTTTAVFTPLLNQVKNPPLVIDTPPEKVLSNRIILRVNINGSVGIAVEDDSRLPGKKVFKLTFNGRQEALAFQQYAQKNSTNPAPVPMVGSTVILGHVRAPEVFKALGVEYYATAHANTLMIYALEKSLYRGPSNNAGPSSKII